MSSKGRNNVMRMTVAQIEAHQAKHGFASPIPSARPATPEDRLTLPVVSEGSDTRKPVSKGKFRGRMNLTETEYSRKLERELAEGEIVAFEYEGMTLRFGLDDSLIKYTPDFMVTESVFLSGEEDYAHLKIVFIEVKGGHIRDKDLLRFKAARNHFKRFEFQLWQKKNREWTQLL